MTNLNSDSIGAVRDQAAQLASICYRAGDQPARWNRPGPQRSKVVESEWPLPGSKSAPTVRDVALNAATGAVELWQAARDRAGETVGSVQFDRDRLGRGYQARSARCDLRCRSKGRGRQGRCRRPCQVGEPCRWRSPRARPPDTGKSAATTTAKTGRNMFGLVLWTGAAGRHHLLRIPER